MAYYEDEKSHHPVYREHDRLSEFVSGCYWRFGKISLEDKNAVFAEFVRVTDDAGITQLGLDEASIAVLRHATHAMRRKLLELHPELAEEVRGLDTGPAR
jgi:hypothetical protein